MRVAVTVAIVLSVITLVVVAYQSFAGQDEPRRSYNDYRPRSVPDLTSPDYMEDYLRRSKIRRLEKEVYQLQDQKMIDRLGGK